MQIPTGNRLPIVIFRFFRRRKRLNNDDGLLPDEGYRFCGLEDISIISNSPKASSP
jgi:hypothetical protein